MLSGARFRSVQRSFSCFSVGLLVFTAGLSPRYLAAQQFQVPQAPSIQGPQYLAPQLRPGQPTFVPQTSVYQSPIISVPIYQQPSYAPIPQPRPIGPVYQAPQGTLSTVPPVGQQLPQVVQSNLSNRRKLDRAAKQATLDAERIRVLEKLLEKYKSLAGQGSSAGLNGLKQKNADLLKELESQGEITRRNATIQQKKNTELNGLVEQLRTQYAQSATKVQTLEKQLAAAGKQLADSRAALKATMETQPSGNEEVELRQQTQKLAAENQELVRKQEVSSLKISDLRDKLEDALEMHQLTREKLVRTESSSQQPNSKSLGIDEIAVSGPGVNDSSITEIDLVGDSGSASVQATSFAQPSVNIASYESKIAQLTHKNRQLADSNAEFDSEVKSLNRELASLKNQGREVTSQASASLVSNTVPAGNAVAPSPVASRKTGWGILGWLIPFLVIGLGVAFFVILKEEFQRPLAGQGDRKGD